MNRMDLINAFAEKEGLDPKEADQVVRMFFDSIRSHLLNGGRVEIRGFGVFKTKKYPGYKGRNPKTGEPVEVAPKVLPVFAPGLAFTKLINGQDA